MKTLRGFLYAVIAYWTLWTITEWIYILKPESLPVTKIYCKHKQKWR